VAEADEEGASSRLTTILSGSQRRASADSLPGAASELPHCKSSFQRTGSERSTPISPPRRDRSEPAHIHAWRQDSPEPASLLKKPRPDPYLVVAHQERRRGMGHCRCPAPLGDAGLKLRNGNLPNNIKGKAPTLPAIQGGRPPPSQSLRPARPPEEGERGAGELPATLKEKVGGERERGCPRVLGASSLPPCSPEG
jgi:hypothetical protein